MNITDQLAEALRATQFGDRGYCPACGGWMVGPYGCTPKSHTDDCPVRIALAAKAQADASGDVLQWAISRWNDEVANRPLVNVHRRTLDDTWRQVIRHCGGDDITMLGPRHDELWVAAGMPAPQPPAMQPSGHQPPPSAHIGPPPPSALRIIEGADHD